MPNHALLASAEGRGQRAEGRGQDINTDEDDMSWTGKETARIGGLAGRRREGGHTWRNIELLGRDFGDVMSGR